MAFSLTACGDGAKDESSGETPSSGEASNTAISTSGSGAMGRYVETEEALPEGVTHVVSMAQMSDGSLRILGDGGGQGIGPWSVMSSADGGKSWTAVDYPWLADLTGTQITSAAFTPDGAYILHMGEEPFAYGDGSGLTTIDFNPITEANTAQTTTLYASPNGDLISAGMTNQILQIDAEGWSVKNDYQASADIGEAPGAAANESVLAIHGADNVITLYDMDSGSVLEEIEAVGDTTASETAPKTAFITAAYDGSGWMYGNDSGVHFIPADSTESELLIDGGLSSLGIPSLNFKNVFRVGENEYLGYATADFGFSTHLFRYVYNPDIPAEPSQSVKVYSMYDNKTLRQAIAGYQLQNPDVRVDYQVGLDGSGGVTAADAMRTLSTELLAGNGPDVLAMDDMDINGYIQKNILADIGDVLSGADTLTNITGAFNVDGVTYAIPARFSIPMMLGDGAAEVKDLADLTAWLATQDTYDIGVSADGLMERFYTACSYRWFGEDGKLDEAAFRADLEQLGTLAGEISALGEVTAYNNVAIDTLLWYGGQIAANYGMVGAYTDITLFDAAIQNRPTGSYAPFPSDAGGVYVPGTILGMNAATASPDNAKGFIAHVLSEEVQATSLSDGFPVNNAAFESLSMPEGATGEEDEMKAALTVENARTGEMVDVELSAGWPSEQFMTEFKTMLRGVSVPVKTNAVIREMIIDETAGYLVGNASLDDVVSSLAGKMELYLSEQA
jgi:hypothetical protein